MEGRVTMKGKITLMAAAVSTGLYAACFAAILLFQEELVQSFSGSVSLPKLYPMSYLLPAAVQVVICASVFAILWRNAQEEYAHGGELLCVFLMAACLIVRPLAGRVVSVVAVQLYARLGGVEMLAAYSTLGNLLNFVDIFLTAAQVLLLVHTAIRYGNSKAFARE